MGRTVTKSIAIIGEGETEWFYFDSLRIACRYPFKVAPDFPQHSDINHILKLVNVILFIFRLLYINKIIITTPCKRNRIETRSVF